MKACLRVEVVSGKDHIAGTPGNLVEAADCGDMVIMFESSSVSSRYLHSDHLHNRDFSPVWPVACIF